jgi:eukaryotic-like serine/threonine-protein kinase
MAAKTTYGGRYHLIERAGSGGMAEVYRARDELLGREVAVKVLSERFAGDRSFVERFRREAQSAANLNHPNIVSLYDYGDSDGSYFIVMEYIDGKSLNDIIGAEGALLPERAAEIASDVAQALDRAHNSGLVHRDIKSGNIMINAAGQTKVTDFGIARAIGGEQTMTQTGMVIGTASYLSPEQAQGRPVDARSDVYSLGCVLYEMLTGDPPFTGDTPLSIAYKHVREDPRPPSAYNPDVPRELDSITLKALAKNPDNRYSSAAEMRDDLQRYVSGKSIQATPLLGPETSVMGAGTGTQVLDRTQVEDYSERDRSRSAWYIVMTLLLLALVALVGWLLAGTLFGGGVDVPEVVGLDERRAVEELQDAGLRARVVDERNSRQPAGTVIEQDPEAGASVDENTIVELVVSEGRRQVTVPELADLTLEEARARLRETDLKVGDIERQPSTEVEADRVISHDPGPGQEVDAGSEVDLVVSSGPATVIVPGVVGLTESEAVDALRDEGLFADVIREPNEAPEGEVFAQDPSAGSEAGEGDTVTISISEGSAEQEMPSVIGEEADEAEDFLEDQFGLSVEQALETEPCAQPPGTVCRQDPEPGEPVSEGDDVILYVIDDSE